MPHASRRAERRRGTEVEEQKEERKKEEAAEEETKDEGREAENFSRNVFLGVVARNHTRAARRSPTRKI